jgi:peptidyl-prolyl cis-trans isomerase C
MLMRIYRLLLGLGVVLTLAYGQAAPPAKTPAPAAAPAKPAAPPAAAPAKPAAPAAATSSNPVVLTVGTEKITKTQFEAILAQVVAQMPPERRATAESPEAKRALAEQLAELKALAQEARRQKLDQTPEAKVQMEMRADQLVAGMLYQQISKSAKPTPEDLKTYYDEHKNEYETVTARHILIRFAGSAVPMRAEQKDLTDAEALAKAQDLRAKIVAGGSFEDLAKAESDDTGSGANGGALGEFTRGRMVPQFEEAAFKLAVNEVSEPIKTQFGYHVIQVQKHDTKSIEAAQGEITEKIGPAMAQKGIDAIKGKTPISFDQDYFGK